MILYVKQFRIFTQYKFYYCCTNIHVLRRQFKIFIYTRKTYWLTERMAEKAR